MIRIVVAAAIVAVGLSLSGCLTTIGTIGECLILDSTTNHC
jgi:hypothetical protein